MRFISRLCMLVAFLLAIGLTCSEMSELFSFADDPSNDFVLSARASDSGIDRVVHERSNCPSSNPIMKALLPTVWRRRFVFRRASPAGAELLLFLSIRRN